MVRLPDPMPVLIGVDAARRGDITVAVGQYAGFTFVESPDMTATEVGARTAECLRALTERIERSFMIPADRLEQQPTGLRVDDLMRAVEMMQRTRDAPIGEILLQPARGVFADFIRREAVPPPELGPVHWVERGPGDFMIGAHTETELAACAWVRDHVPEATCSYSELRWFASVPSQRVAEARAFLNQHGEPAIHALYDAVAREFGARPTPDRLMPRSQYREAVVALEQLRRMGAPDVYVHDARRRVAELERELMLEMDAYSFQHLQERTYGLAGDYDAPAAWMRVGCRLPDAQAEARGQKLLCEWLSPAQRKQFDSGRCFEVMGQRTGRRYRIRLGTTYNIDVLDSRGEVQQQICFAPEGGLVAGDVMLAQKIALETDEEIALRVANRRPPAGSGPVFRPEMGYVP